MPKDEAKLDGATAVKLYQEHGGVVADAARAAGTAPSTFRKWLSRGRAEAGVAVDATPTTRRTTTRAQRIAEFELRYDKGSIIPHKVRGVINDWLVGGGEVWAYDDDMRTRAGIKDKAAWNKYARNSEDFADHIVDVPGGKIVWAQDRATRDALQERALR